MPRHKKSHHHPAAEVVTEVTLELAKSDLAPKNFTEHLSRVEEEGRRNQPRNASPKKTKKRRAEEHKKEKELREVAGALKPFYLPNGVPR